MVDARTEDHDPTLALLVEQDEGISVGMVAGFAFESVDLQCPVALAELRQIAAPERDAHRLSQRPCARDPCVEDLDPIVYGDGGAGPATMFVQTR